METIYDFITKEINRYQKPIQLEEGWGWSMKEHNRQSFLYLNSQFTEKNEDRRLRPNKNIILGMINVAIRTEGFDVKDIELYVDNPDQYFKSPIVRKFHDKWARENGVDTFIDSMVASYCTYGGVLVRNFGESVPKTVDLRTLAFCNQRNILKYPFAIKHTMGQVELREMKKWGDAKYGATIDIESLITICKKQDKDEIEIFEVHGTMPKEWLQHEFNTINEENKDIQQIQVVAYYKDENNNEVGVTLFRSKEPVLPFKMKKRDEVEDRALGRGGVEEMFEDQIWTNWSEIKITEMLESASKTIMLTDNPNIAAKHPTGLKNVDNLDIIEANQGTKGLWQMDTYPRNLQLFEQSVTKWQEHAQFLSSANDGALGQTPAAGTPFKLFEAQNIEGKGMHIYRQGQLATFMEEIYRDWILPHINKAVLNEQFFLTEFSADEMIEIADKITKNRKNRFIIEKILNGEEIIPEEVDNFEMKFKNDFISGGSKRFIKILQDEFKNAPLAVKTNIVGKQKNLALLTDKVVNIVKQYLATPELRNDPEMAKLLNVILESSGLSPIMFSPRPVQMQIQQPQGSAQPLEALNKLNTQQNAGNI